MKILWAGFFGAAIGLVFGQALTGTTDMTRNMLNGFAIGAGVQFALMVTGIS